MSKPNTNQSTTHKTLTHANKEIIAIAAESAATGSEAALPLHRTMTTAR